MAATGTPLSDGTMYRRVVGALQYLTITRPDIGFAASSPSGLVTLAAYSDADWAGCPDDRCSTTGFGIFLGSHLVSWGSPKQRTVSRSPTETEYRAVASVATELVWL
ncbi:uncharacterized mitochondrial protein AtMg00810-like [Macadamia integrifolia]|uniref:uncharacterized mitochondrial protein AtMg00810-like n=1 Tax=Macadamia integrifolia TaxID=60698 RepID=UPI001C4F3F2D|nr:uncharacterized mitochondrial protein AtMg00810-like [Macadamia integrifolia]